MILIRRDSYLLAAFRAADRAAGTRIAEGRIARFAAAVGRSSRSWSAATPRVWWS